MENLIAGIDIGGTKCAVSLSAEKENRVKILNKVSFLTDKSPEKTINTVINVLDGLLAAQGCQKPLCIGISCGGPLDSTKGVIMSPPNLPGWDDIYITNIFTKKYGVKTSLVNDANACALAEYLWGAGRGCKNMVFLTFGTGMGSGIIIDGKLYEGTNGMAGEIGHVRFSCSGPVGYGKEGSFEGFCSGGGIAQMGKDFAKKRCIQNIDTKTICEYAEQGDAQAMDILKKSAEKLGYGLSILIDILNPEKIIIGSIYVRQQKIFEPVVMEVIRREALSDSFRVCSVVPAGLGEMVGDYAAAAAGIYNARYDVK